MTYEYTILGVRSYYVLATVASTSNIVLDHSYCRTKSSATIRKTLHIIAKMKEVAQPTTWSQDWYTNEDQYRRHPNHRHRQCHQGLPIHPCQP